MKDKRTQIGCYIVLFWLAVLAIYIYFLIYKPLTA